MLYNCKFWVHRVMQVSLASLVKQDSLAKTSKPNERDRISFGATFIWL